MPPRIRLVFNLKDIKLEMVNRNARGTVNRNPIPAVNGIPRAGNSCMVAETHIGAGMINKKMFKEIQTFKRQGMSKSAIVKTLDLDPRTVARYFAMREEKYRIWRQSHQFRDKAFDDLKADILDVYEANESQPLQVSSVCDYLADDPLPISRPFCQQVFKYASHFRPPQNIDLILPYRVRLEPQIPPASHYRANCAAGSRCNPAAKIPPSPEHPQNS